MSFISFDNNMQHENNVESSVEHNWFLFSALPSPSNFLQEVGNVCSTWDGRFLGWPAMSQTTVGIDASEDFTEYPSRDWRHDPSCRSSPPTDAWPQDNDTSIGTAIPVLSSSFEKDQSETRPISIPGRRGSLKCSLCRYTKQGYSCGVSQEPCTRSNVITNNTICDAVIDILKSAESQTNATPAIPPRYPPMILERLHYRVSRTYDHSTMNKCADQTSTIATICYGGVSEDVAVSLSHYLLSHQRQTGTTLTSLRSTIVHPFAREDCFWVVLEWTEGNDADVLAIFHIEDENDPDLCNVLMHYGFRGESNDNTPTSWIKTAISWTVTGLGYLKTLFGAAQHILGILELSVTDALTLYSENPPSDNSDEAVIRYTKLLYTHLLKIQEADLAFDNIASKLSDLSSKQGRSLY